MFTASRPLSEAEQIFACGPTSRGAAGAKRSAGAGPIAVASSALTAISGAKCEGLGGKGESEIGTAH